MSITRRRVYRDRYRILGGRVAGLIVPDARCPVCGSELVLLPYELGNSRALRQKDPDVAKEMDVYKEPDYIYLSVEQMCTNPDCTYDKISDYVFTVRPAGSGAISGEAVEYA